MTLRRRIAAATALLAVLLAVVLGTLVAGSAHAGKAHEHGSARLDIAWDPGRLTVELELPLDSLLGFERAPRTDAERQAAAAAIAALRAADTLLRVDPAARCVASGVELVSAALQLGPAPGPSARPSAAPSAGPSAAPSAATAAPTDPHAELTGRYDYKCSGSAPAFVNVGFFDAFKRLSRIDVQAATPKGQLKATLRRPAERIPLAR